MATTAKARTPRKAAVKAPVPVKRDWGPLVVKIVLLIGLLIVGGALGTISYRHGFSVSIKHGQEWLVAILMPAGVDGGLLVSAAAMIAPKTRAATRGMAKLTFVACLAITVGMNALAANDYKLINMAISSVPGFLFVLVADTAIRLIRDMTRKTTEKDTLGPLGRIMLSIKASRARAERRQRDAQRRAAQKAANKITAPTEVIPATAWIKAQTEAQRSAA